MYFIFFFFKQKTAYEMRISDWSSDVCSSDLVRMLRYVIVGSAALAALSTAACTGSRVGDGALYGAGAGAVAGEVVSGSPVTGAAIGAVGGALVGAATADDDDHHHRRHRCTAFHVLPDSLVTGTSSSTE